MRRRRPAERRTIESLPLAANLGSATIDGLALDAEILDCGEGTILFREGEKPEHLFALLSGIAELFTNAQEREPSLSLVWPPELLMPAAALTLKPYLVSARTLGRARLLCLNAAHLRQAALTDANLSFRLTTILCGQFRMLQRNIKDTRLRDAPQRLGAFLYRLIQAHGEHGCVDLPLPKYRLAARLGITPESVSRALPVLRQNGLELRGSRAILLDRQRFERFCATDPLMDGVETGLHATAL